jgi:hypothetical protein
MAFKVKLKAREKPVTWNFLQKQTITETADGIGVDSGTIVIADRKGRLENPFLQKTFHVPKGRYKVEWRMPNTWNGDVSGSQELTVKTGQVIVSDPCYFKEYTGASKKWQKLLKDTDYFEKKIPKNWVLLDEHGGDGEFEVQMKFIPIK